MVHIYNGILLSHKKEQNNATCSVWMDLEIIIQGEVSQTEKDKYMYHLHVESKKRVQMNLFTKQKEPKM